MVGPVGTPVVGEHRDIEVPALDLLGSILDDFHGFGAEGDRGQAGRTAEAFLRSRVDCIDIPRINFDRYPAQRRHGVDH